MQNINIKSANIEPEINPKPFREHDNCAICSPIVHEMICTKEISLQTHWLGEGQ